MKVNPPSFPAVPIGAIARPAKAATPPRPLQDRVELSATSRLMNELRRQQSRVRPDVVEAARADISAGRLGTSEDLDRAVEALLREL